MSGSCLTFIVGGSISLRSPSERSLQVVVLLGQLLQSLLQPHPLVPFCLERLLPSLAVSLSQGEEVSARLRGKTGSTRTTETRIAGSIDSHSPTLIDTLHTNHKAAVDTLRERGTLTLIMALEVMRKSVALSVT